LYFPFTSQIHARPFTRQIHALLLCCGDSFCRDFTTLLCSHVPDIMLASHHVNLRALTSRSGELSASKGPLVAQNSTHRNGTCTGGLRTGHSCLPYNTVRYRTETCGMRRFEPSWPSKEQRARPNSPHRRATHVRFGRVAHEYSESQRNSPPISTISLPLNELIIAQSHSKRNQARSRARDLAVVPI